MIEKGHLGVWGTRVRDPLGSLPSGSLIPGRPEGPLGSSALATPGSSLHARTGKFIPG